VGPNRVRRLMQQGNLAVRTRRRYKVTTNSKHPLPIAANVLDRKFDVAEIGGPNRAWAGDITYISTREGWLYLAVVIDLFSRRVLGWAMSHEMGAELVITAFRMAVGRRRPPAGMIAHSDRGVQYASLAFQEELKRYGLRCSMSRKGNCWDNAVVESFNATIKTELIHRSVWETREDARAAVYEYIEVWYNSKRIHSSLGNLSPITFEAQHETKVA
jgi:transposase InsO family protein